MIQLYVHTLYEENIEVYNLWYNQYEMECIHEQ